VNNGAIAAARGEENMVMYKLMLEGEKFVAVPLEVYRQLCEVAGEAGEDIVDIAHAERIQAELAAGREEAIPSEIANRLFDGENPVRVWREHRGLTFQALADAACIDGTLLSQIELDAQEIGFGTMTTVARVLRVTLGDLVPANMDEEDTDTTKE
jgi:hypothetical protein